MHSLQLSESKLESQKRDRSTLEKQIESFRAGVQAASARIKVTSSALQNSAER